MQRRFICDPLNTSEHRVQFPAPQGWEADDAGYLGGTNHMDAYAWIRVVTDEWEYTERIVA